MTNYLTLSDIRKHLNIDFHDDDDYLNELIGASQAAIATSLNRDLSDFVNENGEINPALKHAIRILVGNFYANRESIAYTSISEIPYSLTYLLSPLKKFKGGER